MQCGAVLVTGFLEDMDARGVGGGNIGVDLMEGGVGLAEFGEGLYHFRAKAPMAVLIGNNNTNCCPAVDWVIVV